MSDTAVRLPLCPFPPIPWWCVACGSTARIDTLEHYPKRTFRNRIVLMTSHGVQTLSLPVERRGGIPRSQDETRRVLGDADRKIWQAVKSAYGRAPFFPEMEGELEALFLSGPPTLGGFNRATLSWAADWLGLDVPGAAPDRIPGGADWGFPLPPRDAHVAERLQGWAHVWADRKGEIPYADLSILDALLHLGPEASQRIIPFLPSGFQRPE